MNIHFTETSHHRTEVGEGLVCNSNGDGDESRHTTGRPIPTLFTPVSFTVVQTLVRLLPLVSVPVLFTESRHVAAHYQPPGSAPASLVVVLTDTHPPTLLPLVTFAVVITDSRPTVLLGTVRFGSSSRRRSTRRTVFYYGVSHDIVS